VPRSACPPRGQAERGDGLGGDGRRAGHPPASGPGDHPGPRLHLLAVPQAVGVGRLRVDALPAAGHGGERATQDPLGPGQQLDRGRLVQIEGEGFVVGVGVTDGQAAVLSLHHEQLQVVPGGELGGGGQDVEVGHLVGRVVAQGVGIGHRGGQANGAGCGLEHLQAHPPERGGGQVGSEHPVVPGPGGGHDHIGLPAVPELVDGHAGLQLDDATAGHEPVGGGGGQVRPQGTEGQAGLDDGVGRAPQSTGCVTPDGRVDPTQLIGLEKSAVVLSGLRPVDVGLHDLTLRGVHGHRERALGSEPDPGHVGRHRLPQPAGQAGRHQLGPGPPARHPDQPEVAHRCADGTGPGLQLDHLEPGPAEVEGVHGAQDPPADHQRSLHMERLAAPGTAV
jgi:hypothetical protein